MSLIAIIKIEKIEFYIQQAKINFSEKINKIDELIAQHGLITKNQSNNSKDAILKILN